MNISIFCVYNLARRVFLSSKVTVADTINQPLKVLKDLVALDAESGLWLSPLYAKPTIPKLFPYDLVYLDKDFRVLETIEVHPGSEFPPHRPEVSSAVVLPPETLRTTQTHVGDHLLVCPRDQVDKLLADLGAGSRAPLVKDPARLTLKSSPKTTPTAKFPETPKGAPDPDSRNGNAPGAGSVRAGDSRAIQQPSAELAKAAAAHEPVSAVEGATKQEEISSGGPQTPSVSISEVVIEKPHSPDSQVFSSTEHRAGLEDLFANWVDSPSAPPSWIAQKAREQTIEIKTGPAAANPEQDAKSSEPAATPSTETARSASAQTNEVTWSVDKKPEKAEPRNSVASSAAQTPADTPRSPQNTTFTVAQYGMWRVSAPTAMGPIASIKRPGSGPNGAKKAGGPKRDESIKQENGTFAKKVAGNAASAPAKAKDAQVTAPPAEKPPAARQGITKLDSPAMPPVQATGDLQNKVEMPAPTPEPAKPSAVQVSESIPRTASAPQSSTANIDRDESRNKIAEVASKFAPGDFTAAIQEKLDRLQTKAPKATAPASTPSPVSALEKKSASETPKPAVKTQPGVSSAPEKPNVTLSMPGFLRHKPDEKGKLKIATEPAKGNGKNGSQSQSLGARFKRWLNPIPLKKSDRRRALRRYVPGVVAHYYTGGPPRPREIADISLTGLYLLTDDRWVTDTMIRMTLQKPCAQGEKKQSITVLSRIVRRGSDGIAAEFVMEESLDPHSRDLLPAQATDRLALARFL